MNTPTNTPTENDYRSAIRLLNDPDNIRKLIIKLGEEVIGRGTVDDLAELFARGVLTALEE